MRLRSDFWVAAYLRRCDVEMIAAVLRRRGTAEAGAVYVKLDLLDGRAAVFGPTAPKESDGVVERCFIRVHKDRWIEPCDAELRLQRLVGFDMDAWIVEVEGERAESTLLVVE